MCSPVEVRDTREKVIALLTNMFGPTESLTALTSTQLYARCQHEGETLAEFSRDLLRIHGQMEQSAQGPEAGSARAHAQ